MVVAPQSPLASLVARADWAAAAPVLVLLASPRQVMAEMARQILVVVVVVRREMGQTADPAALAAPVWSLSAG